MNIGKEEIHRCAFKSEDILKQIRTLMLREVKQSSDIDQNVLMITTLIGVMEDTNRTLSELKKKMPDSVEVINAAVAAGFKNRFSPADLALEAQLIEYAKRKTNART